MGEPAVQPYVSYADYVAAEEKSDVRHEWYDGVVYDMAGGTPDHARLATAVIGSLARQLVGKRCCPFGSDLMVRVPGTGRSTYADVSVVCGKLERDAENPNAVTNPVVIVEVLSDSTEASDRGEKFAHYRRIPALREYVLVSQHKPLIEVFRKNEAGQWVLVAEAEKGQSATLESIGATLSVDEVYADPLAEPA